MTNGAGDLPEGYDPMYGSVEFYVAYKAEQARELKAAEARVAEWRRESKRWSWPMRIGMVIYCLWMIAALVSLFIGWNEIWNQAAHCGGVHHPCPHVIQGGGN